MQTLRSHTTQPKHGRSDGKEHLQLQASDVAHSAPRSKSPVRLPHQQRVKRVEAAEAPVRGYAPGHAPAPEAAAPPPVERKHQSAPGEERACAMFGEGGPPAQIEKDSGQDCSGRQAGQLNSRKARPAMLRKGAGSTPCTELPMLTYRAHQAATERAVKYVQDRMAPAGADSRVAFSTGVQVVPAEQAQGPAPASDLLRTAPEDIQTGAQQQGVSWFDAKLAAIVDEDEDGQLPSPQTPSAIGFTGLVKRSSYVSHSIVDFESSPANEAESNAPHSRLSMPAQVQHRHASMLARCNTTVRQEPSNIWQAEAGLISDEDGLQHSDEASAALRQHIAQHSQQEQHRFEQLASATADGLETLLQVRLID